MTATTHPTRHPSCDTLMRYTAGHLSEGMHVFVASHLSVCPVCRNALNKYEAQAGIGLENLAPEDMSDHCLQNLLQKIDTESSAQVCVDVTLPAHDYDSRLPDPLRVFMAAQNMPVVATATVLLEQQNFRIAVMSVGAALDTDLFSKKHTHVMLLAGDIKVHDRVLERGDVLAAHLFARDSVDIRSEVILLIASSLKQDRTSVVGRMIRLLCGEIT